MHIIHNLNNLYQHRNLIYTLVQRELKARYRGSMLGFFWTFLNPFLLMVIYSLVFSVFLRYSDPAIQPYAVYLFSGLLPWLWFSSATIESTASLLEGGNLVKKVIFPTEILPIVKVLSNLVNFLLSLLMLIPFNIYYLYISKTANTLYKPFSLSLVYLPVVVLVHLAFIMGLALLLSSLNVHFRDIFQLIANLLTFWFFLTPIIYPKETLLNGSAMMRWQYRLNPLAHITAAYQHIFFYGRTPDLAALAKVFAGSFVLILAGYWVFDRLRDSFSEVV